MTGIDGELSRQSAVQVDSDRSLSHGPRGAEQGPPRVVVSSSRRLLDLGLGEAWASRELLLFLAWRDIKVRYKQTAVGVAWAVLQPLLATLIFTVFFGRLAGVPSDGIPYPVFAFVGLLPWTFFQTVIPQSGNSMVSNVNLLTKIYVPRILIPAASVLAGLVDLAVAAVILVGMMVAYGVAPAGDPFLVLIPLLLLVLVTFSLGMWLAALNVRYRDVRYVIPFMLQFLLFASPVIYPVSFIPGRYRWLADLNPLTGIIEGFRSALLGHPVTDWTAIGVSAAVTAALFTLALFSFRRLEADFADLA